MSLTLKQVGTTTVTSPFSDYSVVSSGYGNSGDLNVVNPTYPIFIFDYYTGQVDVGYVVGNTASRPYPGCDINVINIPDVYLQVVGYNYVITGGGGCSCSPIQSNGSSGCGAWTAFVNLSSNTIITYPTSSDQLFPVTSFMGHLNSVAVDLINSVLLLAFVNAQLTPAYGGLFYAIPLSDLQSLLSGTFPTSATWALLNMSNTSYQIYKCNMVLYNGQVYIPLDEPSGTSGALWQFAESSILNSGNTGTPPSSASPTTTGTVINILTTTGNIISTKASIVYYNNNYYVAIGYATSTPSVYVGMYNINTGSVQYTYSFTNLNIDPYQMAVFSGVFLVSGSNNSTGYVYAIDPKTGGILSTSLSTPFIAVSSSGYVVASNTQLNSSSVTFTIYQVLLTQTPKFQNVSITVSGSTVSASGTLIDQTSGNAISGATVYLVGVRSYEDNYSNDVVVINSTTTSSTGSFSVSGSTQSGISYYGVKYVP
jgi:hypothetical protein